MRRTAAVEYLQPEDRVDREPFDLLESWYRIAPAKGALCLIMARRLKPVVVLECPGKPHRGSHCGNVKGPGSCSTPCGYAGPLHMFWPKTACHQTNMPKLMGSPVPQNWRCLAQLLPALAFLSRGEVTEALHFTPKPATGVPNNYDAAATLSVPGPPPVFSARDPAPESTTVSVCLRPETRTAICKD